MHMLSCIIMAVLSPSPVQESGLLSLDRLYGSGEFRVEGTPSMHWLNSDPNAYLTQAASKETKGGMDIVLTHIADGTSKIFIDAKSLIPKGRKTPLRIEDIQLSHDDGKLLLSTQTRKVWRENSRGDYWVFDRKDKSLKQLGGKAPASSLQFAKFSPDAATVGYVRQNNIYVELLADGTITPITTDGSDTMINGTFDWVYEEELSLRDGWRFSPDGKSIAYWRLDTNGVKKYSLINDTVGTYPTVKSFAWPKVGETNSAAQVGVVSSSGGPTKWIDLPGDPRQHYPAFVEWNLDGSHLFIQQLNRPQNTNRVFLANQTTGKATEILAERDACWVDLHENSVHWLDEGKSFTWVSERDGWKHIYRVSGDGKKMDRISKGNFDVIKVESVDEKAGWIYFIAAPSEPTRRFLYRCKLDGASPAERVTPANLSGTNQYEFSGDGVHAVHTHSSFSVPPRSALIRVSDHKTIRDLKDNADLIKKLAKLKRTEVEFFRVDIGDGTELDGWMIKPPDFDATKKYPLFFHIYGEPWDSTVRDDWHGTNGLWHMYLAQQGYLVASIDNRGTAAPRGREWRKSIYRKLGILPSADHAAATRQILKRPYVDASRIGIWGWSGGGTNSLNALLRYPDLYNTAIAVAAESDVRLYDSIYQERYMGLLTDHSDDYRRASVVHLAKQLKGNLLMVHGTGDDNVHYQHMELLINALVAANKPFTMMAYPNRSHSISEGAGTTRHLFELMTRYLKQNLPAGPR